MEITFAPRGILRTVWMKALVHEVGPETVNIRNVKNQPPAPNSSIAMFRGSESYFRLLCGAR